MTAAEVVQAVCLVVILLSVYALIRNQLVYNYRMRLLDRVFDVGDDWGARLTAYDSVSYNRMLLSFRPLRSFYEGTPLENVR